MIDKAIKLIILTMTNAITVVNALRKKQNEPVIPQKTTHSNYKFLNNKDDLSILFQCLSIDTMNLFHL